MALKLKVEKLEDVEEGVRALYTEDKEGGGFLLGVEGLEDTTALKRAKDHEVAEHGKTKAELKKIRDAQKDIDEKARKAAEDVARASGDVKAIEESWRKKHTDDLAAQKGEYEPKLQRQEGFIRKLLVDNVAQAIAAKIAVPGHADALLPHIQRRLDTELRDDDFVTVVRDANGKPSALTVEELTKEIVGNPVLAPLIAGSKASGGGAVGGGKGGGAAGAKIKTRADFNALSPDDQMKFAKEGGTVTD